MAIGAANGALNVLKVDTIGRTAVVLYMKLHAGSLDQVKASFVMRSFHGLMNLKQAHK